MPFKNSYLFVAPTKALVIVIKIELSIMSNHFTYNNAVNGYDKTDYQAIDKKA